MQEFKWDVLLLRSYSCATENFRSERVGSSISFTSHFFTRDFFNKINS